MHTAIRPGHGGPLPDVEVHDRFAGEGKGLDAAPVDYHETVVGSRPQLTVGLRCDGVHRAVDLVKVL